MTDRDRFVQTLKDKLDQWNDDLYRLENQLHTIDANSRQRLGESVQEITAKLHQAENKLTVIRHTQSDRWRDLKQGAEHAWQELETRVNQIREKVVGASR